MTAGGPVGSLSTEAALLLDVLAQRLEQVVAGAGADTNGNGEPVVERDGDRESESDGEPAETVGGDEPAPSHDYRCTGCPICRLLGILHGERPDVTARWAQEHCR